MQLVSFDLETHLFEDGLAAPRPVVLSYRYHDAANVYAWPRSKHAEIAWRNRQLRPEFTPQAGLLLLPDALLWLRAALEDPNVYFVNQEIAFDFVCMAAEDTSLLRPIFRLYNEARVSNVKVRERLIAIALGTLRDDDDHRSKFDLATLIKKYESRDRTDVKSGPDSWRLRYGELEGVPLVEWPTEAVTYPLGDTEDALDVFFGQINEAEKADCLSEDGFKLINEPEQTAADWALKLMSVWGIRSEADAVAKLATSVGERAARLDALKEKYGLFNAAKYKKGVLQAPTANKKELQRLVVRAYGGEDKAPRTDSGRVATDKETLLASNDPILTEIAIAGESLSAVRNTFLPALARGINCPVTPNWQTLVASGRISCWEPNLTNQPRYGGVRECWVARKGSLFFNADYNMAELRSLAQVTYTLFGQSVMRDALNEGKELHLLTAAGILAIPYEECVRRFKTGDPEVKEARQVAKHCNFGLGGGMGPATFIQTVWLQSDRKLRLGKTHEEAIERAKYLKELWLNTYPEMRAYFRYIGGLGENFVIRQHRSGRVRGGLNYCSGANSFFQGLTADGVKAAVFLASMECYTGYSEAWPEDEHEEPSPLYGCHLNAMIHDEIMGEAPEERAPEAATRLGEVMVYAMQLYTPDVATVAEPVIMRRWYKDAKPVFGPDGRLLPWEPSK